MLVKMDTIKTTTFALKYRLKGYKLLQNPKNSNPNEVVMMKDRFSFHGERYDKFYFYNRVHRKIENGKAVIEKKFLMSEYLMNPETKQYSGEKNILYTIEKNDKISNGNKESMSMQEMEERQLPKWTNEEEEFNFGLNLFEENRDKSYYGCKKPTLLHKVLADGNYFYLQICDNIGTTKPFRPSFWQILKSNINGGGMA